jgi:hypothetical protein
MKKVDKANRRVLAYVRNFKEEKDKNVKPKSPANDSQAQD